MTQDSVTSRINSQQARGRVAIALPAIYLHDQPSKSSINFELYDFALRQLGLESVLVAAPGSTFSPGVESVIASVEQFRDPAFWKSLRVDSVVMTTWMKYPQELEAIRAAGCRAISKADSDGIVGVRLFPQDTFKLYVLSQISWFARLKGIVHWIRSYFNRRNLSEVQTLGSLVAADITALETNTAKRRMERFLQRHNRTDLISRLFVSPHLIAPDILGEDLRHMSKQPKVTAIGRWDSWQKDSGLLKDALVHLLQRRPDVQVTVIGTAGPDVFAPLTEKYPSVVCTGAIPREQVRQHLLNTQVLALSSQWESFHIASHEALCLGCTVVGPDVIPVPDIIETGDFGEVVKKRSGEELAAAIDRELDRWRSGKRDSQAIAQFWRRRLDSVEVVRQLLEGAVF